MKIKDKVVVVTGGASGLGLSIATSLLHAGAKVIVIDINQELLAALDKNFTHYQTDVTNYDQAQETVHDIVAKFGKIDALVNNAGVIYSEPLLNIMNIDKMKHSYQTFKKNIEVNLHSVFIMSSMVTEQMVLKRTKGVIVSISSISAQGNAGQSAYSAAKAGVIAMTKAWSKELGSFGIRTIAIAPGFIDTKSTAHALNESIIKHVVKNTPLKKLGEAENVSQSVLHAIENDFINGTVIEVDGGLTI